MSTLLKVFKCFFILYATQMPGYASGEDFSMKVSMSVESDSLVLKFSNVGEQEIYVAKWDILSCGDIDGDYFDIASVLGGVKPDFLGKIKKRKEPNVSQLILLDVDKSVDRKVTISNYYRLSSGVYSVRFHKVIPLYSVIDDVVKITDFAELSSNHVLYNQLDVP